MAKKSASAEVKILELWEKPAEAGEPIGCIASSFTFDSDEFEEECLSRFLSLDSDSNTESAIHLMELETRLLQMGTVAAFVDAANANGKKSPRWLIAPVKVIGGVFHPKVQLLVWSKCIRIILGSANLSENGIRTNSELVFHADYKDNESASRDFALDVLNFFESINIEANLSPENKDRVQKLIDGTRSLLKSFSLNEPEIPYSFMGVQPRKESLIHKISKLKGNVVFDSVIIESPSFDQPGTKNEAAEEVWSLLRQKGGDADVIYNLPGFLSQSGKYEVFAPEELIKTSKPNQDVTIYLYEGVVGDETRPLHSKCYHFQNEQYSLVIMGSSNFSQLGFGIRKRANYEANVAFWIDRDKHRGADNFIENLFLDGVHVEADRILWLPKKMKDPAEEALLIAFPSFVKYIDFKKEGETSFYEIGITSEAPSFIVQSEDEKISYIFKGEIVEMLLISSSNSLPYNELTVKWEDKSYPFTVNIISQDSVPAPDYLKNLSLEEIAKLLSSKLSLHKALQALLRSKLAEDKKDQVFYDPHAMVDTSKFILKRTRQFSWAMAALCGHLQKPCFSREQLKWRISGPIGLFAVKDAVLKTFSENQEEKAFFLAEILGEMNRLNIPSCKTLRSEEIKEELDAAIAQVKQELTLQLQLASPILQKYVKAVEKIHARKV